MKLKLFPAQTSKCLQEENVNVLENESLNYKSMLPTEIYDSRIEIVSGSEVTHIMPQEKIRDATAKIKFDTNYPLVSNIQETHDKEDQLCVKDKVAGKTVKKIFNELESLQVTQIEPESVVDEYEAEKIKLDNKVHTDTVQAEGLVTTETLINLSVADLIVDSQDIRTAKSSFILQNAYNTTEEVASSKESPLKDCQLSTSFASVSVTPLLELKVTEVNEGSKEAEFHKQNNEISVPPNPKYDILEPLLVQEIFIEDKSGKYYPELIVPTEVAKRDILVSNQVITEMQEIQEKESPIPKLKMPPLQEVNVNIPSENSILVYTSDVREKEGLIDKTDLPTEIHIQEDILLHSCLENFETTSHVKEKEFTPKVTEEKCAGITFNEHHHKYDIETNVMDSENTLLQKEPTKQNTAQVTISVLDKNMVEEVNIHEREQELHFEEFKTPAKANIDVKSSESIITSTPTYLITTEDLKTSEVFPDKIANETVITEHARIVTSPFIHDQEIESKNYDTTLENVSVSLIPINSLSVLELNCPESETKLHTEKMPEAANTRPILTHNLKTHICHEITTADQIDIFNQQVHNDKYASEKRDLQTEVTVLQPAVEDQIQNFDLNLERALTAKTSFKENESLNITETIPSYVETSLTIEETSFNKVEVKIDIEHKVPVVLENNLPDSLSQLKEIPSNLQEAELIPNVIYPLTVSENRVLESQDILDNMVKPNLKTIIPDVVPVEESLNISEIMVNEKEREYEQNKEFKQTCKVFENVVCRPVASTLEVTDNTDINTFDLTDTVETKTANVQNIPLKEVIVSSILCNEKESLMTSKKTKYEEATLDMISKEALIVDETVAEMKPSYLNSENKFNKVEVTPQSVLCEAILEEETFVHTSERNFDEKDKEPEKSAVISVSGLKAPELQENTLVEREKQFSPLKLPGEQKVNIKILENQSLETSEILSQSEILGEITELAISNRNAITKMDNIYGKVPNIDEINVILTTQELNTRVLEQKPKISPLELFNIEQTETVTAEKESLFKDQKPLESNITPKIVESEALIQSSTSINEKEKEFESDVDIPVRDASLKVIPHSSILGTEVVTATETEYINKPSGKPESKTLTEVIETRKAIDVSEVTTSEFEDIFISNVLPEEVNLNPKQNISILSSIGTTETIVIDQEEVFNQKEPKRLQATLCLDRIHSLDVSEDIVADKEGKLILEKPINKSISEINIDAYHHLNVEEYHVSESESDLKEINKVEEKKDYTLDYIKPLYVTDVRSEEHVEHFLIDNENNAVNSFVGFEKEDHLNILQITPLEMGETLDEVYQLVPKNLLPNIEEGNHTITVHEVQPLEISQGIEIKSINDSQSAKSLFDLRPALEVNEVMTRESEEDLTLKSTPKQENASLDLESLEHITVTDMLIQDKEKELYHEFVNKSALNQDLNINTTNHLTICETVVVEDSIKLDNEINKQENAVTTYVFKESLSEREHQIIESVDKLFPLKQPQSNSAQENIYCLNAVEQTEPKFDNVFDSLQERKETLSKKETISIAQTVNDEVLLTVFPEVVESITSLPEICIPHSESANYDLEVNKSYLTQEHVIDDSIEKIITQKDISKVADEQIIELKGINQIEIVLGEEIQSFGVPEFDINKKQIASVLNDEVSITKEEIKFFKEPVEDKIVLQEDIEILGNGIYFI